MEDDDLMSEHSHKSMGDHEELEKNMNDVGTEGTHYVYAFNNDYLRKIKYYLDTLIMYSNILVQRKPNNA